MASQSAGSLLVDSQLLRQRAVASYAPLAGMHERAALLGGALEVASQPGAGTEVFLRLSDHEGRA